MRAVLCLGLLLAFTHGQAAVSERDLGEGLTYVRARDLAAAEATLPAVFSRPALVLDLRAATGEAAILRKILSANETAPQLCLVLLNEATSAELRSLVAEGWPGLVTLGPAAANLSLDIAVGTSTEEDRRAWQALEAGADPVTLIQEKQEKDRRDEAAIVRRRRGERAPPTPPAPPAAEKAAPAPTDAVLQRAVFLYRGLKALKKL